jgi:hypothetical protein
MWSVLLSSLVGLGIVVGYGYEEAEILYRHRLEVKRSVEETIRRADQAIDAARRLKMGQRLPPSPPIPLVPELPPPPAPPKR